MVTKATTNVVGTNINEINLANNSVGTDEIQNGAIVTAKILDNQVTTDKLVNNVIITTKILDRNVTTSKIALNGVNEENIGSTQVSTRNLQESSVTTSKINALAVTEPKLAANSVSTIKIIDQAVTRAKLAPNAVSADQIETFTIPLDRLVKGTPGDLLYRNAIGDVVALPVGPENSVIASKSGLPVWSSTVFLTGMIIDYIGTIPPDGWLLANGMTIGNADSQSSARSNADCEVLFKLLWNSFPQTSIEVDGGRGSSANIDWTVGKRIKLPDLRGRVTLGHDTMSFTAANRIPGALPVGSTGGTATKTLSLTNMPRHAHRIAHNNKGNSTVTYDTLLSKEGPNGGGNIYYGLTSLGGQDADRTEPNLFRSERVGGNAQGNTDPFDILPPFMMVSKIIKL